MSNPYAMLSQAGLSLTEKADVLRPGEWSVELIASLDWLRLAEVVRGIAAHAGCELAGSRVLPDGSLVFGMIEQPTTIYPQRALVKISAWNEWGATPESVTRFAQEVTTAKNTRGILVAPAGFSHSATLAAQEHRIEAVDAAVLCTVLQALPPERSDLFFTIATAGTYAHPTCPVCLAKLERVDPDEYESPPAIQIITTRGLCAEHVACDLLDIASGAEVDFLYPVISRAMRVWGHAKGDFSCEGTITIQAGGTLDGRIAARSVNVQEGGELRGQFRILEGTRLEPFVTRPDRWHWGCRNPLGKPACREVKFSPHG